MVNALEHRTDVSPTRYSSVYEQLLEFPSKINEPELENEVNLEEFSEDWSKFLEEETPRELKEDYPAQIDPDYLENQYNRMESLLEESLYEYAVLEFSSFFEEILKRSEIQENPFKKNEYKNWLLKDCWNWEEASERFLREKESKYIEKLYDLRNNILHPEENYEDVRAASSRILDNIIPLYNEISPYEINADFTSNDTPSSDNFYDKLIELKDNNFEEYISLELFKSLEKVESNLDLNLETNYEEDAEDLVHYANERKRWLKDDQFEDIKKAIEYRREISHNIEPNKNVDENEINWENVLRFATKMHIISHIQEVSILDKPAADHNLKVDTSLPFNLETRYNLQEFINSRFSLDQMPKFSKINWKNLNTSTSTSKW